MPDWLRLRLVSTLDPEQNQQIREALNALWLSVATGGDRPIELEIAQRNPLAASSIAKAIFRKLRRKSSEQSVLRDRVFASIMLGRSLEPLAVRIPRMWRELMRPEKAPGKQESCRAMDMAMFRGSSGDHRRRGAGSGSVAHPTRRSFTEARFDH